MQRAAIYARYSTDEQRATSIDDQVRRAKEKALSLGYEVPDNLIYSDSALTGQESGIEKRIGYKKLLTDWNKGAFQALIVDEVSRLSRDNLGLATLQDKIEKSGVRMLSTDGIDSSLPGWQLSFGFRGVMASHAIRETAHRVVRAMLGQLERGFMIAAPPFGYRLQREEHDAGTFWIKHESEALLVSDIFRRRRNGSSFSAIALSLNERGVPSPRPSRKSTTPRYWRPATVRQLLGNTIYRGIFVWNGSAFAKAKAKRSNKELKPIEYQRPALRIVDDEMWFDCNKPSSTRVFRGGGKHVFAGILNCGTCDAILTITTGGSAHSAYCAQCAQAKRVGVPNRTAHYASTNGIKALLIYAINALFSDAAIHDFREMLREKLNGGQEGRIIELKREISYKERAVARYLDLLGSAEVEDPILTKNYKDTAIEKARLCAELKDIQQGLLLQDKLTIERQLAVNPLSLIPKLFEGSLPIEHVRVVIHRLFPVIKFIKKSGRFTSVYYIEVAPGAAFAEVADTKVIEGKKISLTLQVTGGAERPSNWIVSECK